MLRPVTTPRTLSAADAAGLVRPVDGLAIPLGPGQPASLLHALGERDDWEDLQVYGALLLDLYALFAKPGVQLLSGFFGPAERALAQAGHDIRFVPGDFRRFASVLDLLRPRVMATAVAPPDASGAFSLSLHAGATVEALRQCGRDPGRLLIAEVTPGLPRTVGLPPEYTHRLQPDEVDVVVESDRPVRTLDEEEPSDVERAIAEHIRAFVPDRATLQTGIGGVPNAVAGLLAQGDGSEYGIHTEMFTTGLMKLVRSGKVTNQHKGVFDGLSVCTFALGTEELHTWLDGNEDVRFLPVDIVNDPSTIARNQRMISINGALAVDLAGQLVADFLNGRQHSGIGGHEDFVGGASMAAGDHSVVCLPSTARVGDRRVSRLMAHLPRGSVITTPRHQVDLVATEFGVADLRGRTTRDRARALADIAHPAARDALRKGEDPPDID